MKKSIIYSATLVVLTFSACTNSAKKVEKTNDSTNLQMSNFDTLKLNAGQSFYQCPMHPEVVSGKSGMCLKCEMDLVEIKKK